jgi:SAM-dependent methyltransferase
MMRIMAPVTERMLADLQPGQRVLDLATGTGEPALTAATLVGPDGWVLGLDFSEEMVDCARKRAARQSLSNVEFRCADAESFDKPSTLFDLVTIRWALMFMQAPALALSLSHAALKPGGQLSVSCWTALEENPWASVPLAVIKRYVDLPDLPPNVPGLFAFADGVRLRSAIEAAGFSQVRLERVHVRMADFQRGEDYVAFQRDLGHVGILLGTLPEETRLKVAAEIASAVEEAGHGRAQLDGVTWLATATA